MIANGFNLHIGAITYRVFSLSFTKCSVIYFLHNDISNISFGFRISFNCPVIKQTKNGVLSTKNHVDVLMWTVDVLNNFSI